MVAVCFISLGTVAISKSNAQFNQFFDTVKESNESKEVIVTVNGEPIYRKTVEIQNGYNELQYTLNNQSIKQNTESSTQEQLYGANNENEVLKKIIESKVLIQEARKLGISYDFDVAYNAVKSSYDIIKEKGGETYELLSGYIKAMGLSEKEYLEIATNAYCDQMCKYLLKKDYEDSLKANTVAYEQYVSRLVSQAEIVYFDKK